MQRGWEENEFSYTIILKKRFINVNVAPLLKKQSLIIIISLQSGCLPLSKYFLRWGTHYPQAVYAIFGQLMFRKFFLKIM